MCLPTEWWLEDNSQSCDRMAEEQSYGSGYDSYLRKNMLAKLKKRMWAEQTYKPVATIVLGGIGQNFNKLLWEAKWNEMKEIKNHSLLLFWHYTFLN